jgi:hypothetical protein
MKIRDGDMPKTYLHKKLAEKWMGGPLTSFNTFDMEQGQILEQEAIPWLEFEKGIELIRVGLITTDDGRFGCSPDGLIKDVSGIEIKCPAVHTHIKYLLNGKLPEEYAPQVHGAMYVTGLSHWYFLSYHRRLPKLLLRVERDEQVIATLDLALTEFHDALEIGMQKLTELNGGPPRRNPYVFQPKTEQPKFHSEMPT